MTAEKIFPLFVIDKTFKTSNFFPVKYISFSELLVLLLMLLITLMVVTCVSYAVWKCCCKTEAGRVEPERSEVLILLQ